MLSDILCHLVDTRGGIDRARRRRGEARILGKFGIAGRPAEALPFGIRTGAGRDVALAGLEHGIGPVVRIGGGMLVARLPGIAPAPSLRMREAWSHDTVPAHTADADRI